MPSNLALTVWGGGAKGRQLCALLRKYSVLHRRAAEFFSFLPSLEYSSRAAKNEASCGTGD